MPNRKQTIFAIGCQIAQKDSKGPRRAPKDTNRYLDTKGQQMITKSTTSKLKKKRIRKPPMKAKKNIVKKKKLSTFKVKNK